MAKITKEEVLRLARMSAMTIHEDEIQAVAAQLESIVTYAERVKEIAQDIEEPSNRNVNVVRTDTVKACESEKIMACAPAREENFFVVPMILENE